MIRHGRTAEKKDVLLELVSRDVKELQRSCSEEGGVGEKVFSDGDELAGLLCDHLDHILMHGLINFEEGYWPFVRYFTRGELVQQINKLKRVTTNVGKGRSWLYSGLNEQSMESYVRMFTENQEIAEKYYLRDAFMRDIEHLLLLLTLVSGLDFISFDLHLDCDYLDYGASRLSSQITSHPTLEATPRFFSSNTSESGGRLRTVSDPTHNPTSRVISNTTRGAERNTSHEPSSTSTESNTMMMSSSLQMTSSRNLLERMSSVDMNKSQVPTTKKQGVWSGAERKEEEEEDVLVAKERKSGRSKRRRKRRNDEQQENGNHVTSHVTPEATLFEAQPVKNDPISEGVPQLIGTEECDYETEPQLAVLREKEEEGSGDGGDGGGGGGGGGDGAMSLEMELALATKDSDGGVHQIEQPILHSPTTEHRTIESSVSHGPTPRRVNEERFHQTESTDQTIARSGEAPELEKGYDIITQKEIRALEDDSGRRRRRIDSGPPERPTDMTEEEKLTNDVKIDETMRVVFSIDIFLPISDQQTPPTAMPSDSARQRAPSGAEEEAKRLLQVKTPSGLGQYKTGYILITTEAVYLLRRDGVEGIFSREFGTKFKDIDHLVIGLGWQSIGIVYRARDDDGEEELCNSVIITGSEAVSRSMMESIQEMATQCPTFKQVIPKNRDSEIHVEAIEKELIKLGSETSMDIVECVMVSWEQMKGTVPTTTSSSSEVTSGLLYFKKNSRVGLSSWKQGYFRLIDGVLYQYNNETDKSYRASYTLSGCGGCTRSSGDTGKQFVLSISLPSSHTLLLATPTETELTKWQQTLCEAVLEVPLQVPVTDKNKCSLCTLLVTKEKIHILQEDLIQGVVQHVTCCDVTSVENISVNSDLRQYCTLTYDDGEDNKGVWLLCFISEFELGKFERAISELWKAEFQIDLPFSEVDETIVIDRARNAVDLLHSTGCRSDSITRGRTEFTYSSTF